MTAENISISRAIKQASLFVYMIKEGDSWLVKVRENGQPFKVLLRGDYLEARERLAIERTIYAVKYMGLDESKIAEAVKVTYTLTGTVTERLMFLAGRYGLGIYSRKAAARFNYQD